MSLLDVVNAWLAAANSLNASADEIIRLRDEHKRLCDVEEDLRRTMVAMALDNHDWRMEDTVEQVLDAAKKNWPELLAELKATPKDELPLVDTCPQDVAPQFTEPARRPDGSLPVPPRRPGRPGKPIESRFMEAPRESKPRREVARETAPKAPKTHVGRWRKK